MSAFAFDLVRDEENLATADVFPLDEESLTNVNFASPHDWAIDTPILMRADRSLAGVTDMPLVSLPFTIISKRVADALLGLGGFEVSVYAIQLLDAEDRPLGSEGDFVVFHVRTLLDVVDTGSPGVTVIDRPGSLFHGRIRVSELAILRPAEGFPTCFRVEHAASFGPLVNDAGRAALEALGPRGFQLLEVPSRDEGPPLA